MQSAYIFPSGVKLSIEFSARKSIKNENLIKRKMFFYVKRVAFSICRVKIFKCLTVSEI